MKVKPGTLWWAGDSKYFRVIRTESLEDHEWVYYREDFGPEVSENQCRKFSCYLESFIQRFRQCPE